MTDDDNNQCCVVNKEEQLPSRSQKFNSFSIDSLLSDNKSLQCSNFVVNEQGNFANLSDVRMHCEENVADSSRCMSEEQSMLRSSDSCPSASYSRFSEGKFLVLKVYKCSSIYTKYPFHIDIYFAML